MRKSQQPNEQTEPPPDRELPAGLKRMKPDHRPHDAEIYLAGQKYTLRRPLTLAALPSPDSTSRAEIQRLFASIQSVRPRGIDPLTLSVSLRTALRLSPEEQIALYAAASGLIIYEGKG